MPYLPEKATAEAPATVAEALAAYCALQSADIALQLANSGACLARLIARFNPHLPARPDHQSAGEWLATVAVDALDDPKRLLAALGGRKMATELGYNKSSWRAFRRRLKPFLKWWQGELEARRPGAVPLPPAWVAVVQAIAALAPDRKGLRPRAAIGRLAHFATAAGVLPTGIDTPFLARFRDYLVNDSGLAEAKRYYREAEKAWGHLAEAGKIPLVTFYHPAKPIACHVKREHLPAHFQEVLDDLERCMRSTDPHDWLVPRPQDLPPAPVAKGRPQRRRKPSPRRDRPLAEATITNNLRALLGFLGYLIYHRQLDLNTLTFPDLFRDAGLLLDYGDFLRENSGGDPGAPEALETRQQQEPMVWHLKRLSCLCFVAECYLPRRWPDAPFDLSRLRGQLRFADGQRRPDQAQFVPPEQVEKVLTAMDDRLQEWHSRPTPIHPRYLHCLLRDRLIVAFLLETGVRAGNLRTSQFDEHLIPETYGYECRFITKNRRDIRLSLSPRVLRILEEYLRVRKQLQLQSPFLIVTTNDRPLPHTQLWAMVNKWFQQVLHCSYSPQDFRRTLASRVLQETGDMDLAKLMLFDSSEQVIQDAYDVTQTSVAFGEWHQLLDAIQQQLPGAAAPPIRQLLERARDPQFHQRLTAIIAQLEAHPPTYHLEMPQ